MINLTDLFLEKQMQEAVKDVAQSLGGDVKQTESELLMKLLNPTQGEQDNLRLAFLGLEKNKTNISVI